jgi:hypothetical protein
VLIRRSKTDQVGAGQEIVVPRGLRIRPVEAVQAWLTAAKIETGPLFRCVRKGGKVRAEGLRGIDIALAVKPLRGGGGPRPDGVLRAFVTRRVHHLSRRERSFHFQNRRGQQAQIDGRFERLRAPG